MSMIHSRGIQVRAFIVEDNPVQRKYLKTLLCEQNVRVVGEAATGEDAVRLIARLQPEVVFLDIALPESNGMDVGWKIDTNIHKIFVTGDHHYALKAFELGSLDYLLKPVSPERLEITLKRLRKIIKQTHQKLILNLKSSTIALDIQQILFIEKVPILKKVTFHTLDGECSISGTLNEYELRLKNQGFARTHNSFIVNVNKIKKLVLSGDKSYIIKLHHTAKEVPLSRKYAPMLKPLLY